MATENVTQLQIKQAAVIFEEIANQAVMLDRICYHYGADGDLDAMSTLAFMLRRAVSNLGMLADMGAERLGGIQVGDVEDWLLPPIYPTKAEELT